jgi:hypothetical protein
MVIAMRYALPCLLHLLFTLFDLCGGGLFKR